MNSNDLLTGTPAESIPAADHAVAGRMVAQTGAQLKVGFPARELESLWPSTCQDRVAVLERVFAAPFRLENPSSQRPRNARVQSVLGWLASFPGETWQLRWQASGAEAAPDWRDLFIGESVGRGAAGSPEPHLSVGLLVLICSDVIRPSLGWLLRFAPPVDRWPVRWPARVMDRHFLP